jgi:purine-binding chemotaxis protein CheW
METDPAVAVDDGAPAPEGPQWVFFRCDGRLFATPADTVREILTPLPFTRIPGCGREVCGLVGVRGRVVTVFDLGAMLGLATTTERPDYRLLLVDLANRVIGLAVDEVTAVTHAEADAGANRDRLRLEPEDVIGTCKFGEERPPALKLDRIVARWLG